MKRYALIVAGGKGKRMKSGIPKQFMLLGGKPLLYYSLKTFADSYKDISIIVVLPKEYFTEWKEICKKYKISIKHQLAEGGETRFQSVKNGLKLMDLNRAGVVAIHDAARPLISQKLIKKLFKIAEKEGNVIPVTEVADSLRVSKGSRYTCLPTGKKLTPSAISKAVDRVDYRSVQTPQCFRTGLLQKAYNQNYNKLFTDDATVVESIGEKINLTEGEKKNIKITLPEDIEIAEALFSL